MRHAWITLLLLACCALAPAGRAAPTVAAPGEVSPPDGAIMVASGVTLLPGRFVPGEQPDGNSVLLRGKRGVIVVDSGRHPEHTRHVLDGVRAQGGGLAGLINTHWHLDHAGGNAVLRQAYPQAPVLASDAIDQALPGFLAEYRVQLDALVNGKSGQMPPEQLAQWRAELERIDDAAALRPSRTVAGPMTLKLGGRALRLGVERGAASGGDVWVLDRATRTLIAGDLVTLPVPLFDTACAAGWQRALARLDTLAFDRVVPGHGAPMDRAGFATYRRAFDRLLECAATAAPAATCKAQWQADAAALLGSADRTLADNLLDYYLQEVLRAPPARRDRYCPAGSAA